MTSPAADPSTLPELLDTAQVAAATKWSLYTARRKMRDGQIPAIKLPGSSPLAGPSRRPRENSRRRTARDTVEFLHELAAAAPALSESQRDAVRAVRRQDDAIETRIDREAGSP